MHSDDLLTDWVKLMRHHTSVSDNDRVSDRLRRELDAGYVAETVFGASAKLGLTFEARHAALELFERAAARLAIMNSEQSGVVDRLGGVLVACVQLASKINSMKKFVYPRDINKAFPRISEKEALNNECELLKLLNFRLDAGTFNTAACLEILVYAMVQVGIITKEKSQFMLETCRHVLDLVALNRSLIRHNLLKFGNSDPAKLDWRRDRLQVSASVSVAAVYAVIPAGVAKAVGAMEVISRIDGVTIAVLAKAIIKTISELDSQ